MNTEKRIKDIGDINSEFQKINEQLKKLESRFTAIAIDYKYYIDTNFSNREIFEHRDNVFYRFKSARLHLDFLVRQHFVVEKRFEEIFKKNPSLFLNEFYPSNPFFDEAEEEVSSIFDSIVYHLVSIFDYISNLIVFVCDKNKTKKLEWTQLAKHARSNKSIYYEKPIGKIISNLDNQFVKKLYNHRSYLIRVCHKSVVT